jgi:hypothetical protein
VARKEAETTDFVEVQPTESSYLEDLADLVLDAEQAKTVVWYVYRDRGPGEVQQGARAGHRGPFVCKFQGSLDLETLAKRVGPGLWWVIAREGRTALLSRQVEIDGEPWPLSRINPPPPLEQPAPPAAPAFGALPASSYAPQPVTLETVRAVIRDELRERAAPAVMDPTALFFKAFELARDFNKPSTPTDPNAMLSVVVDTLKSGIELGRTVNPDAPQADPMAPLWGALAPIVERIVTAPRATPAPVAPALPRGPDGVPVVGTAPTPPPTPAPTRANVRAELVAEHLALGIQREQHPDDVADAVSLILEERELGALAAANVDELRQWLGAAGLTYPGLQSPQADRWLGAFLEAVRNPPGDRLEEAENGARGSGVGASVGSEA